MIFIGLCQKQDVGVCAFLGWCCKNVEIGDVLWFSESSAITAALIPTVLLRPLHFYICPGEMQWKWNPCSSALAAGSCSVLLSCQMALLHLGILSALLFCPELPAGCQSKQTFSADSVQSAQI